MTLTVETGTDVSFDAGAHLIIEGGGKVVVNAGARFLLNSNASIIIRGGELLVTGTSGNPVEFKPAAAGIRWGGGPGGIEFQPGSKGWLTWCRIEGAERKNIKIHGCSPTIQYCNIFGSNVGIEVSGSGNIPADPTITENWIHDNIWGVHFVDHASGELTHNLIYNNQRPLGIEFGVENGIHVWDHSNPVISHNLVYGSEWGIEIGFQSNATIEWNLFAEVTWGILYYDHDGQQITAESTPTVERNYFSTRRAMWATQVYDSAGRDIPGRFSTELSKTQQEKIQQNVPGRDPMFVDPPVDFELSATSPAVEYGPKAIQPPASALLEKPGAVPSKVEIVAELSDVQWATGVAVNSEGTSAWVTEEIEYTGRFVRVDLASGAVTPIASNLHLPGHLVVVGQRAFVAGNIGAPVTLVLIDLSDGSVTPISTDLGGGLSGVAVNGKLTTAYVVNYGDGVLSRVDINPSSPTFKQVIQVVTGLIEPRDIVIDKSETVAYVTEQGAGRLVQIIIDPTAPGYGSITPIVDGLRGPRGLTLNQDGDLIYLAEEFAGKLNVVNIDQDSAEYGNVTTILHYPHLRDVALSTDEYTAVLTAADQGVLVVDLGLEVAADVEVLPQIRQVERPGHVSMTNMNARASYLYRSFLQTPWGATWGPDGRLYIADLHGHHVVRLAPDGTMDDLGIWQKLHLHTFEPWSLAFDSKGTLHVSDGPRIYAIGTDGNPRLLSGIQAYPVGGIDFGPNDELYYTDWGGGRVLKRDSGGRSHIVARGIQKAENLAFGLDGTLYVTQGGPDQRVMKVDVNSGEVKEFFRDEKFIGDPIHLAIDKDGDLWVRTIFALFQLSPDGGRKPFSLDGKQYSGNTLLFDIGTSAGITFDDAGRLWIASFNSRVMRLDPQPKGSRGMTLNLVVPGFAPSDIEIGPEGEVYAWNSNTNPGELWQINPDGKVKVLPPFQPAIADTWVQLAVDNEGDLYLGLLNGEIKRLDPDGNLASYGWLPAAIWQMNFGADGYLYASIGDWLGPKSIFRVEEWYDYTPLLDRINGQPLGSKTVHVEAAPDGGLYIYDEAHKALYYRAPNGQIRLVANVPGMALQGGLAVSPDRDVFLFTHPDYVIYRLSPEEKFEPFASGVAGDPNGVCVSPDGRWLYVGENGAIDMLPIEKGP